MVNLQSCVIVKVCEGCSFQNLSNWFQSYIVPSHCQLYQLSISRYSVPADTSAFFPVGGVSAKGVQHSRELLGPWSVAKELLCRSSSICSILSLSFPVSWILLALSSGSRGVALLRAVMAHSTCDNSLRRLSEENLERRGITCNDQSNSLSLRKMSSIVFIFMKRDEEGREM